MDRQMHIKDTKNMSKQQITPDSSKRGVLPAIEGMNYWGSDQTPLSRASPQSPTNLHISYTPLYCLDIYWVAVIYFHVQLAHVGPRGIQSFRQWSSGKVSA